MRRGRRTLGHNGSGCASLPLPTTVHPSGQNSGSSSSSAVQGHIGGNVSRGLAHGVGVALRHQGWDVGAERWALPEQDSDFRPLVLNGVLPDPPASAPFSSLIAPLQQMGHQHLEPAPEFPPVAFSQALELLCNTVWVNVLPFSRADLCGRGLSPLKKILVVEVGIDRHGRGLLSRRRFMPESPPQLHIRHGLASG